MFDCKDLDSFMRDYGELLAQKARQLLQPLHVPGRDPVILAPLLRAPHGAQSHVVTAAVKALSRQKAVQLICEMGTGKTYMAAGLVHTVFETRKPGTPYRSLAVCPGHLVDKWKREILATVPGARVTVIDGYRQVLAMAGLWARGRAAYQNVRLANDHNAREPDPGRHVRLRAGHLYPVAAEMRVRDCAGGESVDRVFDHWAYTRRSAAHLAGSVPQGADWFVIGKDKAKLSSGWRHAYLRRSVRKPGGGTRWLEGKVDEGLCRCPRCGEPQLARDKTPVDPAKHFGKNASRKKCVSCKEELWADTGDPWRYAPARIIQKHMKGFFDYAVLDEAHDFKGDDSAQADAIAGIASACKKVVALTGTLMGGYAWHVRGMLFRMGVAHTLLDDGLGWIDKTAFNKKYGRIEVKVTSHQKDGQEKPSRGRKHTRGGEDNSKRQEYVRPGVMPTLFRHLIGNCIFLSLKEVSDALPRFTEQVIPVAMGPEQRAAYDLIDRALTEAIRQMVQRGNRQLLGPMLACLLGYPDHPYGWGMVGYWDDDPDSQSARKIFRPIVNAPDLPVSACYPKERALVELCLQERSEGRQTWAYCTFTQKKDCLERLEAHLQAAGLKVRVLRSEDCEPKHRERWIQRNGNSADVVLSHPDLVKTGLDFFDRQSGHNFVSIVFYQTGYNLYTLRQAARRAWRLGQRRECRVYYLYYQSSMQERAMTLMGRKLSAAMALEGQFSSEGLAAMSGDEGNIEMELAKSLAENLREDDAAVRAWQKLSAPADDAAGPGPADDELDDILAELEGA